MTAARLVTCCNVSFEEKASTGGAESGAASDGKPGPNVMDPGQRGGRNNAVYVAAVAALGVAFWWRYARESGGAFEHSGVEYECCGFGSVLVSLRARGVCSGVLQHDHVAWHPAERMVRVRGSRILPLQWACCRVADSAGGDDPLMCAQAPTRTPARRRRTSIDTSNQPSRKLSIRALIRIVEVDRSDGSHPVRNV